MRPIWAVWEVPLGPLLPDGRDRASVDGVECDGTKATGVSSPPCPRALALAIGSLSSTSPLIIHANTLFGRS